MVQNSGTLNIVLFAILLVSIFIYYSITNVQIENFTTEPCYFKEQNILPNENTVLRECSVYLVDEDKYSDCDQYFEYYEMSTLELEQALLENTNPQDNAAMRAILNWKKANPDKKGCKIRYDGWQEIQKFTDQGETHEYSRKNINYRDEENFELWNTCFLEKDRQNDIALNNTVKGGCLEDGKYSSIYFEKSMDISDIFNSVCNNAGNNPVDLQTNGKYFLELECQYVPDTSIRIVDAKIKKGEDNGFQNITMIDINVQQSIDGYFNYLYKKSNNDRFMKWRPKNVIQESYLLKYDKCNTKHDTRIINIPDFNLTDIGVDDKMGNINNSLTSDVKQIIDDTNNTTFISPGQIYSSLRNAIQNHNSNISRLVSEIKSIQDTTPVETVTNSAIEDNEKELMANILKSRRVTNGLISRYFSLLLETNINKDSPNFDLSSANLKNKEVEELLNQAINTEYSETDRNFTLLYADIIADINKKFKQGVLYNLSLYNKSSVPQIDSTDIFSQFIKCTAANRVSLHTTRPSAADANAEHEYYLTEQIANIKLPCGYYKFFIEKTSNEDVSDVFITFVNTSGALVYQKVAYYYGAKKDDSTYIKHTVAEETPESNNKTKIFSLNEPSEIMKLTFKYQSVDETNKVLKKFELFGTNSDVAKNDPNHSSWKSIIYSDNANYNRFGTINENYNKLNNKENGLIARYNFENNNDDMSGNGYNLSVASGRTVFQSINKVVDDYSAKFEGYLTNSQLNLNNTSFSVCCWVYKYSNDQFVIVGMGNVNSLRQQLHIGFRNNNRIMFAFYADDCDSTNTYDINNKWIHVAYTYEFKDSEGNQTRVRKIYLNGEQIATSNSIAQGAPYFAPGTLKIGKQNYGNSINANLDDLRIYNRVLSGDEIKEIINRKKYTSYSLTYNSDINSDLHVWYKFDEDLKDYSGNNLDAIKQGVDVVVDSTNKINDKNSIKFDGGYLLTPSTDFSLFTNGITICTWVKFDNRMFYTRIIDFGDGRHTNNIVLSRWAVSNKLIIHIFKQGTYKNAYTVEDCIFEKRWIHVTFTIGYTDDEKKNVIWKLYVNGRQMKLHNETNHIFPARASYASCYIGKSHWGDTGDPRFVGNMQDFRIYKKVITHDEITDIMQQNPNIYVWYKFDKDLNDWSGISSLKAVAHGSTITFDATNKHKGKDSVRFNGGNNGGYLTIPSTNFTTFTNGITICTWVKFDNTMNYTRIIDFGDGRHTNNIVLSRWAYTNKLIIHIFKPGTYKNAYTVEDCIFEKRWIHVTFTIGYTDDEKKNVIWKLYVNGRQMKLHNETDHIFPESSAYTSCYIGKSHWGDTIDPLFVGNMQDFRIYKYALNASEILQIMESDDNKNNNSTSMKTGKYKHYLVKSKDGHRVQWPKVEIYTAPKGGYTSKKPFFVSDSNSGYYGIYTRSLKKKGDNTTLIVKKSYIAPANNNCPSNVDENAYLSLTKSYTNDSYTLPSNTELSQATIINDQDLLIYENHRGNIFPVRNPGSCNDTNNSLFIDISDNNFYIRCDAMTGYQNNVTVPTIMYEDIISNNVSAKIEKNKTNLKNLIQNLSAFRKSRQLGFKCMVSNDTWQRDINKMSATDTYNSDIIRQNEQKNQQISNLRNTISKYQKVITDIETDSSKNIDITNDVLQKIKNKKVVLSGDRYQKYVRALTKNLEENKYFMYFKLDI